MAVIKRGEIAVALGSPKPSTRPATAERKATEDYPSGESLSWQLRTKVGILNGENAFEAIGRDAMRVENRSSLATQKLLVLGIAFYGLAILLLLLLNENHILAFFFAAMGVFLTALGDFLKRRPSARSWPRVWY
ncbi:MAG: hypothetical protein KAW39_04790 [Thermoplasmata archaeon]|nr:hypothetical protein [Thermoplasmata archaeon]